MRLPTPHTSGNLDDAYVYEYPDRALVVHTKYLRRLLLDASKYWFCEEVILCLQNRSCQLKGRVDCFVAIEGIGIVMHIRPVRIEHNFCR